MRESIARQVQAVRQAQENLHDLQDLLDELDNRPTGWESDAAILFDNRQEWVDTHTPFVPSITLDEQYGIDRDARPESGKGHTSNLIAL